MPSEYENKYEPMFDINQEGKLGVSPNVLRPGQYFASGSGGSITNVPALSGSTPFNQPAKLQVQQPPMQGYEFMPNVQRPTEQTQQVVSALAASPGAGSWNIPEAVTRTPEQLERINPLDKTLSELEMIQRGKVLRKEGSLQERRKVGGELKKEQDIKESAERLYREKQAMDIADQRKIAIKQAEQDIRTAAEKELLPVRTQEKLAVEEFKQKHQSLEKKLDRELRQGLASDANNTRMQMQENMFEEQRKRDEDLGLDVGSDKWMQAKQESLKNDIAKLQASNAFADERQRKAFESRAELDMAQELIKNYKAKDVDEALSMVRGKFEQERAILKTPEQDVQTRIKIEKAVKVADMFGPEVAQQKFKSGEWTEQQYKSWQKAVILKRLTTRKENKTLEDEVKAEYGLE
jgi:hypothetical protein